MTNADAIADLFGQVRRHTIRLLESAEPGAELFAPAGTSNHLIWHAGHVIWVQELLCLQIFGQPSELPDDWGDTFGMNCRPVCETTNWPNRDVLLKMLGDQQEIILAAFANCEGEELQRVADPERGPLTVLSRIIHGCHDEARHSGEMYLLLKQFRATNNQHPDA